MKIEPSIDKMELKQKIQDVYNLDVVYRILFEEKDPIEVKSDFEGLKEDVLPVLPNMKEIENNLRRKAKEW